MTLSPTQVKAAKKRRGYEAFKVFCETVLPRELGEYGDAIFSQLDYPFLRHAYFRYILETRLTELQYDVKSTRDNYAIWYVHVSKLEEGI